MIQVLPDAMSMVEHCLDACPTEVQGELCAVMLPVVAGSNDYTRKIACVRWYQQLAAKCGYLNQFGELAQHDAHILSHALS